MKMEKNGIINRLGKFFLIAIHPRLGDEK